MGSREGEAPGQRKPVIRVNNNNNIFYFMHAY
jgi:hypothetical protein